MGWGEGGIRGGESGIRGGDRREDDEREARLNVGDGGGAEK